jgi:hypothetical protein
MPESSLHIELVRRLAVWASTGLAGHSPVVVYSDLPENAIDNKPPSIEGFYPDLYCTSLGGQPLCIGEAKTLGDLESKHSRQQLTAYLRFLLTFAPGLLVVAVPWHAVPAARSLVRAIQRQSNTGAVMTHFIEKLPG